MKYNLTVYRCNLFDINYYIINTETDLGIHTFNVTKPTIKKSEKDICSRVLRCIEPTDKFIAQYVNLTYEEVCSTIQLFREITNEV